MRWWPAAILAGTLAAQEFPVSINAGPIDRAIEDAIGANQIPGAVCIVGTRGKIVHRKAYGRRARVPVPEPMTLDTIFDAASLTKVVATTTAIAKLVEQGKVEIEAPVTQYLPDFQGGRSAITVRQLLTHFSGLRPDLDLEPPWSGYELGIQKALQDKPIHPPETRFAYSDINFELLGEIVRVVSGKPLDVYVRDEIFAPLGMAETGFLPARELRNRIAPTEWYKDEPSPRRGTVHDPTASYMGGVAGHAGLFTTASDLARFAQMMLAGGEGILKPGTILQFTRSHSPPGQKTLRGLGWDIDSQYSAPRGEIFPIGGYGHTGFTGTSLWIDPASETYIVLLTNSVHPERRPAIAPLRRAVATAIAAERAVRNAKTKTGLDVLAELRFAQLTGKRVGLITNHTGIDAKGRRNIDVMLEGGVKLQALFSPEHGISGKEDHENVANSKDAATGIPVFSLYSGKTRRPSEASLRDIDVLVFDIQDIGARYYTFVSTLVNALEEAARRKLPFVVLDRPNPINGIAVEGPMIDADKKSFVGILDMPLRHGMTIGELARMANAAIQADMTVIEMQDWHRGDWFDETNLPWIDPSPNMRSLNAALLYPGIAMLEYSRNYSVGRGTDTPFEWVGAEFIRGPELAAHLNGRGLPGIRVYPVRFTPNESNLANQALEGVRFVVTDREAFEPVRFGVELAGAIEKLYPGKLDFALNAKLIGDQTTIDALKRGEDPRLIHSAWQPALREFRARRAEFLLYR